VALTELIGEEIFNNFECPITQVPLVIDGSAERAWNFEVAMSVDCSRQLPVRLVWQIEGHSVGADRVVHIAAAVVAACRLDFLQP